MTSVSSFLEDVIDKCGGFGRYQLLLTTFVFSISVPMIWTMLMMSFAAAEPDWLCVSESSQGNQTSYFQNCNPLNTSHCVSYNFDDTMSTVINEWDLVCDQSWVSATITTIQMAGVLVGGLLCGQMGDTIGRKPTMFSAIFLITVTNLVAFFSVSWQMFATLRFFMGVACGIILGVPYILLFEFTPSSQRAILSAFPIWSIFSAFLALISWLIHDWKYLHLTTALAAGPLLLSWWIVPESFRWLVVHHRFDRAREIISTLARVNGAPVPDLSNLETLKDVEDSNKIYTFLDIFRGKYLLKNTIYQSVMWTSCGYLFYAITFGVKDLSGNLYLNMFLMSIVDIPANLMTIVCNNRIGRKWTTMGFFIICAMGSLGVAVVRVSDVGDTADQLINGFALLSKLSVSSGWVSLYLLSVEIYPTAIRNLGIGFQNTVTRFGAMAAPQIILLSERHPGLMYFLGFALMTVSALCAVLSTETRGKQLQDTITKITPKAPCQNSSGKIEISVVEKQELTKL